MLARRYSGTEKALLVTELYQTLESWYPLTLRCEWDHDGIMCLPCENAQAQRILIALDVTDNVLSYAIEHRFDTIVSHHPLLFSPINSFVASDPVCKKLLLAVTNGISILSFHTRMDAAQEGVNDALAQTLALCNVEPLGELARIGTLVTPMKKADFLSYLNERLGTTACRYSLGTDSKPISRVAICGGSGKDFLPEVLKSDADAYVTGELSYHAMLDLEHAPIALFACGHAQTEQPICSHLQKRLQNKYPSLFFELFVETHTF